MIYVRHIIKNMYALRWAPLRTVPQSIVHSICSGTNACMYLHNNKFVDTTGELRGDRGDIHVHVMHAVSRRLEGKSASRSSGSKRLKPNRAVAVKQLQAIVARMWCRGPSCAHTHGWIRCLRVNPECDLAVHASPDASLMRVPHTPRALGAARLAGRLLRQPSGQQQPQQPNIGRQADLLAPTQPQRGRLALPPQSRPALRAVTARLV